MYRRFFKPVIDFFLALVGLCLLWPIMLLACIISSIVFLAAPIFIQHRLGRAQKEFLIFKIRSLRPQSAENEAPNAWGLFLRRSGIDELPQLINVLLGQMAIVGPRPLLSSYQTKEDHAFVKRHEVKPGITGWAQLNGRDEISWEEKFALDAQYVDEHSFAFDLKIMFRTIAYMLGPKSIDKGAKNATARYDKQR